MKKYFIALVIVLIVFMLFIIKPIRTNSILKSIAEDELENIQMYDSLRKQLSGPVVSDKGIYMEFKWFKYLEWGDTAALYIDVYKRPSSFSFRDRFYSPRITMNYQWYYFLFPNGTSKIGDILTSQNETKGIDFSTIQLHQKQDKIDDSIRFLIKPERLLVFLKKGYFTVVEKKSTYAIVDFYEPIAEFSHKNANDSIVTMSAKVFLNDSLEVFILPIEAER